MTTAYKASFEDAQRSLSTLQRLSGHTFISDDIDAALLPSITTCKEVTDAHLITLAKRHGLKLATLDQSLLTKTWAVGCAENPLALLK
jgi:predicted nucleic acid-binding protein